MSRPEASGPLIMGKPTIGVAAAMATLTAWWLFPTQQAVAVRAKKTPANAEFVSVNASRGLDPLTIKAINRQFLAAGAKTTVIHQGTIDMTSIMRKSSIVKAAPSGAGFPMSTLAIDPKSIGPTMGPNVGKVVITGRIVVGATAAATNGVVVGDTVTLNGWERQSVTFEVGSIEADTNVGGAELVLSTMSAAKLGFDRPFSIRAYGLRSRALARSTAESIVAKWSSAPLRAHYSWSQPLLDDTIPQSGIKALLGEFWVMRGRDGGLRIDPVWKATNTADVSLPIVGVVRCDNTVAAAASKALQDLIDQGLKALVHARDSRKYGGCFSARVTRSLVGSSGHNLSRHTWGAAIDINPTANPYGSRGQMDVRIIKAFRRQGFVWGGSFLIPDPMHFEYVGSH